MFRKHHIGIIGYSLEYTLSPLLHTTAFKKLNLPCTYGVFTTTKEYLPLLLKAFRKFEICGANVTIPYKEDVVSLLDRLDEEAQEIGAVNTIVNENNILSGFNTDIYGLKKTLEGYTNEIKNSTCIIIGAGGAGKAAIYTLAKYFFPKNIIIYNRSIEKPKKIQEKFEHRFSKINFSYTIQDKDISDLVSDTTLIINTTPLGQLSAKEMPLPANILLSNKQIILDIIYNSEETALLRYAKHCGARAINGMTMFIYQAAQSFKLWTGKELPFEVRETIVQRNTIH